MKSFIETVTWIYLSVACFVALFGFAFAKFERDKLSAQLIALFMMGFAWPVLLATFLFAKSNDREQRP